jgi:hypothetical protein
MQNVKYNGLSISVSNASLVERVAIVRGIIDVGSASNNSAIGGHSSVACMRRLGKVIFSVSESLLFEILDSESAGIIVLFTVIFFLADVRFSF